MINTDNIDVIQKTIDTLISQLDFVSSRSKMEMSNKSSKSNLIEYSGVMLQLSRTISELIIIKRALENNNSNDILELVHGRLK